MRLSFSLRSSFKRVEEERVDGMKIANVRFVVDDEDGDDDDEEESQTKRRTWAKLSRPGTSRTASSVS